MSLVSVIIPSYNQARFVAATVETVLAQTYPHLEIIVVDDGSIDDTTVVLRPYREKIHYIHQENRGLAGARNRGFLASQGDYLLFLDSDDLIQPEMVASLVALLAAHPEFGLTYSAWRQINETGTQILGEVRPNQQGHMLKQLLLRRFFFFASGAMIRRACLEQVGLFDEALKWGEDADLWLRLARAGYAFGYLDQPLLHYRVHANSMTANVNPQQVQNWLAGLNKFFADPGLPADIRALEAEAYSILHYETAGRYYRLGAIESAQFHLRQAMQACPGIDQEWLLEWIAGTALDPRTERPEQFIDLIFDNLVPEATPLRALRYRAHSRYHLAAAFSAYERRDPKKVCRHIWPALKGDPSILGNRGFLHIAIQSLFEPGHK